MYFYHVLRTALAILLLCASQLSLAVTYDNGFVEFDDAPLQEPLSFPDWFKLSFLDLREDIKDVQEAGKQGLMIYFGQKYCAYCKQFLETDLVGICLGVGSLAGNPQGCRGGFGQVTRVTKTSPSWLAAPHLGPCLSSF